jgi:hypothetical protein
LRGREGRDFNEREGREGEGRERILIVNVFGSRREGRDYKIKLLFYPYNITRVFHDFKIIRFINN